MIVTDGAAAQRIGYSAAQQSKLEERRERIAPATAGSVQRYEGASRRCRLRKMAGEAPALWRQWRVAGTV